MARRIAAAKFVRNPNFGDHRKGGTHEEKSAPRRRGRDFGTDGDGAYAYFDVGARKHVIETIKLPRGFPEPEQTFPEQRRTRVEALHLNSDEE